MRKLRGIGTSIFLVLMLSSTTALATGVSEGTNCAIWLEWLFRMLAWAAGGWNGF